MPHPTPWTRLQGKVPSTPFHTHSVRCAPTAGSYSTGRPLHSTSTCNIGGTGAALPISAHPAAPPSALMQSPPPNTRDPSLRLDARNPSIAPAAATHRAHAGHAPRLPPCNLPTFLCVLTAVSTRRHDGAHEERTLPRSRPAPSSQVAAAGAGTDLRVQPQLRTCILLDHKGFFSACPRPIGMRRACASNRFDSQGDASR